VGTAQYETQGHGPYGYDHSQAVAIMSGMMRGSMLSCTVESRYMPMFSQPYTTSAARTGAISNERSSYRATNPHRFCKLCER